MTVQLDHTVVLATDNRAGAELLADILGLEVGPQMGPFVPVTTANGVTLFDPTGNTMELITVPYGGWPT